MKLQIRILTKYENTDPKPNTKKLRLWNHGQCFRNLKRLLQPKLIWFFHTNHEDLHLQYLG